MQQETNLSNMDLRRLIIEDELLTSGEVCELLGFSRERLKQICQDGRIRPLKRGIYMKSEILAFKEQRDRRLRK
ncbi:MAG: helix-turn-helix domain-containing protein [Firmicutes bacterium]|nr:helix-turn-helix domain-containing protein [Bacillota bacterium]